MPVTQNPTFFGILNRCTLQYMLTPDCAQENMPATQNPKFFETINKCTLHLSDISQNNMLLSACQHMTGRHRVSS